MKKSLLLAVVLATAACASPDAPESAETTPDAAAPAAEAPPALPFNANLADADRLAAIDFIGADLAEAIVEARPYLRPSELHAVVAVAKTADEFESVYTAVFVPLDLNDATREEILLVPGVGDRMAHEFEEYRPYVSMEQFRREIGKYVDDDEVERLARLVYVPIDLNTATEDEILAIPGVGERMLHEFEEYRPYVSMEQFRREIGKYVDDAELARLERYVEIRTRN